jgi:hypothetical protein
MATPIKSLFPPIEKKPFLLNKQKKREPSPDVVYQQIAFMFILLISFLEYCFAISVFEFDFGVLFCSCSTMKSMAEEHQRKCMNLGSFISLIYWNPITKWVSHLFSHMTYSMISCKFLKILEDSFVRFVSSRHWIIIT